MKNIYVEHSWFFRQTIPIRKFWNEQMVSRILTTAHKSNAHMYEANVLSNI